MSSPVSLSESDRPNHYYEDEGNIHQWIAGNFGSAKRKRQDSPEPDRFSEIPNQKEPKMFKSKDVICLFDNLDDYPILLRFNDRFENSNTIFQVQPENRFREIVFPSSTFTADVLKNTKAYFEECVRVLFGGLKFDNMMNCWIDNSTEKLIDRLARCKSLSEKYGTMLEPKFKIIPRWLNELLEAFTRGLHNSAGRTGLIRLFDICFLLLGKALETALETGIRNIGGSALDPCCTSVVQLVDDFGLKDLEERKHFLRNIDQGIKKAFVPDAILYNGIEVDTRTYYLFGEVKSGVKLSGRILRQGWFQVLRGLMDSDHTYGVVLLASHFEILKLSIENEWLLTYFQRVQLIEEPNGGFNIDNFLNCIYCITKIIEDNAVFADL